MNYVRLGVGLLVAAGALIWTFSRVNFAEFAVAIRSANWAWFLPAAGFFLASLLIRATRWSSLMGGTAFWTTFHAMNIGYMMNVTLPGRLGEIGRAYVIGERTPVSMTKAVSSVVVERVLDLATVVLMLAAVTPFVPMAPEFLRAAVIAGAAVVAFVLLVAVVIWQAERLEGVIRNTLSRVPRISAERWVERFRDLCASFRSIGTAGKLARIMTLTVGLWFCVLMVAFMLMGAFLPARFDAASLMVIVANLGGAIPTPGGLGPAQALATLALDPFGIDATRGVAFVFVWYFAQIAALIALGLLGLTRVGLSLGQLRR
jgi:glycosyltransferase 2 family protein